MKAKAAASSTTRKAIARLGSWGIEVRRGGIPERHDDRPSARLLDIAEQAIPIARRTSMTDISERITAGPRWPDEWPGEHYKLLPALVEVLEAERVIEIGTYQGLAALALLQALPPSGHLATFDIIPWQQVTGHVLRDEDFDDPRLVQYTDDITEPGLFGKHQQLFESADLIFVDTVHDGVQERQIMQLLEATRFTASPVVMLDDIRFLGMERLWRGIKRPRLDMTAFGHWSGTGLIDFS
jgi:predicted O-methyltransferase YrrM